MTLLELYNLKLDQFKRTGIKEKPWKLLAMLLLSKKNSFEALRNSQGEFYKKYKTLIDPEIDKVEKDFELTREEIIEHIEKTVVCDDYEDQRIWFVFADGFGVLNWGLLYRSDKTPEEIYSEYYDTDELSLDYDTEERLTAKNIKSTSLNDIINKILENSYEFYEKVYDELTPEEKVFITSILENKNCLNCTNGSCRVPYQEKVGNDEFGEPMLTITCFG